MLAPLAVHAHGADDVVIAALHPIDVEHQDRDFVPAALQRWLELLPAGFHHLPAHRRLPDPHRRRPLRCHPPTIAGGDTAQQRRNRGRRTPICRSPSLTRPGCEPRQRISPLGLPGAFGPATSVALGFKIVSSTPRPASSITVPTAGRACSIDSTNGNKSCPLAWQKPSMLFGPLGAELHNMVVSFHGSSPDQALSWPGSIRVGPNRRSTFN